jgi:phosphatidate cytidylyltransferase
VLSRILSTVVLWSLILGSLWLFGAHAAVVLLTVLTALTLWEFYGLTAKMGARPFRWMGVGFSVVMTAGPYYLLYFKEQLADLASLSVVIMPAFLVLALLLSCIRVLGERDHTNRVETIAATVGGLVYIPFMLQFLVGILTFDGNSSDNLVLCLWVVAVSKFCDVGALLTGLAIGKHKMAPEISPKKTWEGAVGGVLVSAGIGAAIAFLASGYLPEELTPPIAAGIAAILAIVTIVSDLIESVIKRRAGAKDSGRLIPGIGGALDLCDSLILTAPVAFFLLMLLG